MSYAITYNEANTTMSLKALITLGVGIGIGVAIGAEVVRILTQPIIDELKRRIKLLEDRIHEFQTRYENDLNAIKEEHTILYRQIQELRRTPLTPETKQKVEELFQMLEQVYQSKLTERGTQIYVYVS
jgi:predicted RNase H-like nuclease (RuvC/YqgF family)